MEILFYFVWKLLFQYEIFLTAQAKGLGNLGASSAAPSDSIIIIGFRGVEPDESNSSKS